MRYVIIKNGRFFHCFNLVQQEMKRRPVVVYRVFKTNYPSLQNAEINALIAVCIAILRVNVSIPTLLFRLIPYQILLPRIFGSGDSLLRCAVSPNRPSSSFLWKSDQFSSLARNHGRRVWKNRYILDISIQAEKSHTQCIVWCCACR